MIVLSSCYEDSCFRIVHPYIIDEMIFTLVPLIFLREWLVIVISSKSAHVHVYTTCMYAIIRAHTLTQSRVVFVCSVKMAP